MKRRRRLAIAALGAWGLVISLASCGESGSDEASNPCAPESLVWVYSRIIDTDSPAYPTAIFRLQDGSETRLTDDVAARGSVVSPDGSRIAFQRGSEGDPESAGYSRYRLYVMNADGADQRPLLDPGHEPPVGSDVITAWDQNPVWSPDGEHIAFFREWSFTTSSTSDDVSRIMIVPSTGGKPRPLPGGGSRGASAYAWSADSSRLAWVTAKPATLHWARIDGTDSGQVRLPHASGDPAWTKGGREIVVRSVEYGPGGSDAAYGLYRVDVETGQHTHVGIDPVGDLWALPTGELAGIEPGGGSPSSIPDSGTIVVLDPDRPNDRQEITSFEGAAAGPATAVPDDPDGWAACTSGSR